MFAGCCREFLAGRKNKNVLMEILAAFLLPENFIAVYGTLPSEIKKLICAIAVNHYVRAKTAEEIMGRKCLDKWSRFGYGLIDELACFCRANSIYNANTLTLMILALKTISACLFQISTELF